MIRCFLLWWWDQAVRERVSRCCSVPRSVLIPVSCTSATLSHSRALHTQRSCVDGVPLLASHCCPPPSHASGMDRWEYWAEALRGNKKSKREDLSPGKTKQVKREENSGVMSMFNLLMLSLQKRSFIHPEVFCGKMCHQNNTSFFFV